MKKIKLILTLAIGIFVLSSDTTSAQVSVGVSITAGIPPPVLPVYVQPVCPADGYLWVPGYWAYGDDGYYWVPGIWVLPPHYGYLWTPAWWGFAGGVYGFHAGYWGPHVGFYGGINYGYGYNGSGFYGGRWEGNSFRYNTAVVNVNTTVIHNTYVDRTVIVNNNRTSFNGGAGGISARPTAQEESAMRERHVQATSAQVLHVQNARQDRNQYVAANHGRPATTALSRPGGTHFDSHGNGSAPHNTAHQSMPQHSQVNTSHPVAPQHQSANAYHPAPAPAPKHQQANAYHMAPQHQQPQNNHQVQPHQQAYNNHAQSPQQHVNHQQHMPAPQHQHGGQPQHGGEPHPREH